MFFKTLVFCAMTVFMQSTFCQYIGTSVGNGVNLVNGVSAGCGNGIGLPGPNIGSSGPLIVTSISPIGPSGVAVASENVIEGVLSVNGQLPYLSAVAFEGALPTAGSGIATCGCGSGSVGIVSEGLPNAPLNNIPRRNLV